MKPIPPEGGGTSTSFSSSLLGRCTWNELRTTDLDAALAFYDRRFGWKVSGSMPMGPMGDYMFLTHGDDRIGAAMRGGDQPAAWTHYFRVADIDAAVAAIEAGGGTVLNGPHEVPGGDRIVIATDPQGARVGFVAQA
jgi:predicted enzyme related to lactoylglutathione lyase